MRRAPTILPAGGTTNESRREAALVVILVALLALGAVLFAGADTPQSARLAVDEELFSERAVFCPPVPEGSTGVTDLIAGPLEPKATGVLVEPLDREIEPLEARETMVRRVDPGHPHNIVGYGELLGASYVTSFTDPIAGSVAANCSTRVSPDWYFPQGSSADGFNQRLVLYNPFPEDAVVRITFLTPDGARTRASLSDVPVPSGSASTIVINRHILQHPTLATHVSSVRGRVVAWKAVFAGDLSPGRGVSYTLGAPRLAPTWYLPAGSLEPGARPRLSLMNPNDEEAVVTVSLVAQGEAIQPPGLVEMPLRRRSALDIQLRGAVEDAGDFDELSIVVQSVNGVRIAAERSIWYGPPSDLRGFATEVGARAAARTWWLGPTMPDPDREWVAVLNTGDTEARVTLTPRIADAGPGDAITAVIPPGGRTRLRIRAPAMTVLVLAADSPVVAERISYAGRDVSMMMGVAVETEVLPP